MVKPGGGSMPSKRTEGKVPSHDIEYTAKRRINWKNDLAIGHEGEKIVQRFFGMPRQRIV